MRMDALREGPLLGAAALAAGETGRGEARYSVDRGLALVPNDAPTA